MWYFACDWRFSSGSGVYDSYVGGFGSGNCETYNVFVSGAYLDFSLYSGPAVSIWAHGNDFQEGTETPSQATEASQGEAENVFQVQIGGWPMEEELGPTGDHTDPDQRRGLETFWAILGIGQANAVPTDEAPPQQLDPNCITLNARHVSGLGPIAQHASVVYMSAGGPYHWVSAFDGDERALFDGLLVSQREAPSDNPRLTQIVSPVTGPGLPPCGDPISNQAEWASVLIVDGHYDDDLTYDAIPTVGVGYNSNGYAHGLLNASGLTATVSFLDRLVGWSLPVPYSAFQ